MKQKFEITGMTCSACSARVETVTGKLPGVKSAAVNLMAGTMLAVYDENTVTAQEIIAAVTAVGYGAKVAGEKPSRRNEAQEKAMKAMKKRLWIQHQ